MILKFVVHSKLPTQLFILLVCFGVVGATISCSREIPPLRTQSNTNISRSIYSNSISTQSTISSRRILADPDPNGPSGPDTTEYLDQTKHPELRRFSLTPYPRPHEFPIKGSTSPAYPPPVAGDGQFGTIIYNVNTINTGAYAGQQIHPNYNFGQVVTSTYLYAPTLMPNNRSPVEMVTIYHREPGWNSTVHEWGVWDHRYYPQCPNDWCWAVLKGIDGTDWMSKYARNIFSDERWFYYNKAELTRNPDGGATWRVYLYNFNTNLWELQAEVGGFGNDGPDPPNGQYWFIGWNIWESHWGTSCPPQAAPVIESTNLRVRDTSGLWPWVTEGSGWGGSNGTAEGIDFACGYAGRWIYRFYDWQVYALF